MIGVAAEEIFERHVDAEAFHGGVHGLIERTGNGNGAVEVLDAIQQGNVVTVIGELAIAAGRLDVDTQSVWTTDLECKGARRLDLLTGGELNVLPDIGLKRESFCVLKVVGHPVQPIVGAGIDGAVVICGQGGGSNECDGREQTEPLADRRDFSKG